MKTKPFILVAVLGLLLVPTLLNAADLSKKISLDFRDTDIRDIFKIISEKAGLGLVVEKSVRGNVTLRMLEVPILNALDTLAMTNGFEWSLVNDTVIVCDGRKLPVFHRVLSLAHVNAEEAVKALQSTIRKDIRASTVGENFVVLSARQHTLKEAERILKAIDKPSRHFLGFLQVMQDGKTLQSVEFHGTLGMGIKAQEGTTISYPGGADQPPKQAKVGLNFVFEPEIRAGSETLEGDVAVSLSWIEKYDGPIPAISRQNIQTTLRAFPGKAVKIARFGGDREILFSFTWEP